MNYLLIIIIILMLPMWLIGTFIFTQIMRAPKGPADKSNRFNTARLVWFAATRQELFAELKGFEWVKSDELKNVTK